MKPSKIEFCLGMTFVALALWHSSSLISNKLKAPQKWTVVQSANGSYGYVTDLGCASSGFATREDACEAAKRDRQWTENADKSPPKFSETEEWKRLRDWSFWKPVPNCDK